MWHFARLFKELDSTNRTGDKVAALVAYFREAPPRNAAWGLYVLLGGKLGRGVTTTQLRAWTAEKAGLPPWLVDESYDAVGDLAEALAYLLPDPASPPAAPPLHEIIEEWLAPLKGLPEEEKRARVFEYWGRLDRLQRLVWHKLLTGNFRVGVARTLVVRALSECSGLAPAEMAHRLMGAWSPTAADYARLLAPADGAQQIDPGRPYPFFLAHPLEETSTGPALGPERLGSPAAWQAEWKWDGIRAQLIHRAGQVLVWSRGEELITQGFPEIAAIGARLPAGSVLDGEILVWRGAAPLPFALLQQRILRKKLTPRLLAEAPAVFMAYDLLEAAGHDVRGLPLQVRRERLEALHRDAGAPENFLLSPVVPFQSWPELADLRAQARSRLVEGFMLKRLAAPYGVGRVRGDWWKWKIDPHTIDAVLLYAQRGHGRRADLYTDYTFGVWHEGALVPVAKAYSGLTDREIQEVDQFVRRNTLEKFGPVRTVRPELVFEIAFEGIQASPRHKSGVALRFPRMSRWRRDKPAAEADTLETLRALLHAAGDPPVKNDAAKT